MRTKVNLSRALQEKVDRELERWERIRRIDKPVPQFFTRDSTVIFLVGIPWTAFAIFWTCGAADFSIPDFKQGFDFFPLVGVPFILIGLGMLYSPLRAYRKALRTVYVITDRRAITINGGWGTTIRSYPPQELHNVYRREKRDGTGDVIFSQREWRDSDGDRRTEELGFLSIREPKKVERMLKELAEQSAPAHG